MSSLTSWSGRYRAVLRSGLSHRINHHCGGDSKIHIFLDEMALSQNGYGTSKMRGLHQNESKTSFEDVFTAGSAGDGRPRPKCVSDQTAEGGETEGDTWIRPGSPTFKRQRPGENASRDPPRRRDQVRERQASRKYALQRKAPSDAAVSSR